MWGAPLLVIVCLWVKQAEVVTRSCLVTESVPAIPALGLLVLMAPLAALLWRWLRPLALRRGELLLVYTALAVAASISGGIILRMFLPSITAPFYFDTPQNEFANLRQFFPAWMVPQDPEIIRQMYEPATDLPGVPWRPWALPIAHWTLFFLAIWLVMLGMTALIGRQWTVHERLTFPLVYLPMEIASSDARGRPTLEFFRNPLMWVGFGMAALFNVGNMLNAWNPGIPCLGRAYDLGALFTERPWSALRPLSFAYRPELVGLGYLVSLEVSGSAWIFHLFIRSQAVAGAMLGYQRAGFPYGQEQGLGAYLLLAGFFVWVGRDHLRSCLRQALGGNIAGQATPVPGSPKGEGGSPGHDDELMSPRTALWLMVGGVAGLYVWATFSGLAPWLGGLYLVIVLAVALVYSRIRAETGVPLVWMFPYYQQKRFIINALGSAPIMRYGGLRSATMFANLAFLSRSFFSSLIGYQIEGFKIAEATAVRGRQMSWALVLGLVGGVLGGWWVLLTAFYDFGAHALAGWQGIAIGEYTDVISYQRAPVLPDVSRTVASVLGFALTGLLGGLRQAYLRFPLHPLGYAMAASYGSLIWGPMFAVWLVKALVMRFGGMGSYRRLIPLFLGLALGHFFIAGAVWGALGTAGSDIFRRYRVIFG